MSDSSPIGHTDLSDTEALISTSGQQVFPSRLRNSGLVKVNTSQEGPTANVGGTTRSFMLSGPTGRIRQNGTVDGYRFHISDKTNLTSLTPVIYRLNSAETEVSVVGKANTILVASIVDGWNDVVLTTPIPGVVRGDYVGFDHISSGGSTLAADTTPPTGYVVQFTNASLITGSGNAYPASFDSGSSPQTWSIGVEAKMRAPDVVLTGDSIAAGRTANYTPWEATDTFDWDGDILHWLEQMNGIVGQNNATGSWFSADVVTNFTARVGDFNPRTLVLLVGINDLANNGVDYLPTYLANIFGDGGIVELCAGNDPPIDLVLCELLPIDVAKSFTAYHSSVNTWPKMNAAIDLWNTSLRQQAIERNISVAPIHSSIAKAATSNGETVLWDIIDNFDADHIHLTPLGYKRVAQAISAYPSDRDKIPLKNSTANETMSDVLGNKDDGHDGNSAMAKLETLSDHIHGVQMIYPELTDAITVTCGNAAPWTLGAFVEIVPVNTITEDFDLHFVSASMSANAEYQLNLYAGTTLISEVSLLRDTVQTRAVQVSIQTPINEANTQIQAKLASSTGAADTAAIHIMYHVY